MRIILHILFFVFISFTLKAQGSGDIAVIYHLSETNAHGTGGDRIGLVLLAPVTSGTSFKVTENGSNGTQLDTDEGIITINATTGHAFGKIINITLNAGALVSGTAGFTYTFSGGSYAASTGGDQSIVYRNAESAPTFIYSANFDGLGLWAICNNGPYPNECGGSQCEQPTSGETFAFGVNGTTEFDNNWYSGPTSFPNKAAALAAITSTDNWSGDDNPGPAETAANALTGLGSLPVNWLSFDITAHENGNLITWQTASEINNSYFEVERSMDGTYFTSVTRLIGAGNKFEKSNYAYIDISAEAGNTYYYRVKQVDYDGRESYSDVRSIYVYGKFTRIKISPNPAQDVVNIHFEKSTEIDFDIDIIRYDGRVIKSMSVLKGSYFTDLDISELPFGMYRLRSKGVDFINQTIIKSK